MSHPNATRTRVGLRRVSAAAVLVTGLGGLTACGNEADPADGGVTLEDLQAVDDRLTELEDRVDAMGDGDVPADGGTAQDVDEFALFADPEAYVGEGVTVTGEVTDLIETTDDAAAFRIGGESGDPIAVVALDESPDLAEGDVVTVEGTVLAVDENGFDEEFGVAAEMVFDDPAGFFEMAEGDLAISADRLMPEDSSGS